MELIKARAFNSALCLSYSKKAFLGTPLATSIVRLNKDKKTIFSLKAALDRLNFKYNAVFNSSYTYYIILNKQLKIVDFNLAYVSLMNDISDKQLKTGVNITNYFTGDMLTEVLSSCKRALAGETFVFERKIKKAGGGANWWLVEYSPAYSNDNKITGLVLNIIDITSRKNHEVKIESQNARLRAISLMQSHEIRGPLCTLMGLMDILKSESIPGNSGYLALMDITIKQLDKKIHDIVECASDCKIM